MRKSHEAAVVEWGHSAVISALEAAVAGFGPQTSRGAYFEVETSVVLADPIDGAVDVEESKLKNAAAVEGNMVVMTNSAFSDGVSGVDLARLAQNSGAAALMVVNVQDTKTPDYIYSLQAETDAERRWAEEHCDIPVVMVSLTSGNVLTTAQDQSVNQGMPERVRLYAGGDRPFFEDVSTAEPMVYLIHHLLTDAECDELMAAAESSGPLRPVGSDYDDPLEGDPMATTKSATKPNHRLERVFFWRGALKGHKSRAIDERLEQVTGFPADHMTDVRIERFAADGADRAPHYDRLPDDGAPYAKQLATITIFLNDEGVGGGEMVFPSADPPVRIRPKKGMAVVHHNLNEDHTPDPSSIHADLPTTGGTAVKWTARRWIHTEPLSPARRIVVPLLAAPTGGRLPGWVRSLHRAFCDKLGHDTGGVVFDRFVIAAPILLVALLAQFLVGLATSKSSSLSKENNKTTKKGGGGAKSGAVAKKSKKNSNKKKD